MAITSGEYLTHSKCAYESEQLVYQDETSVLEAKLPFVSEMYRTHKILILSYSI